MQRRGWMRIVEASISIVILLSVLFFLYTRDAYTEDLALDERARSILTELSSEASFREAVITNQTNAVHQAVAQKIPESHLLFEVRICEIGDVCGKSNFTSSNVYAAERVISSSLERNPASGGDEPRKVRLFIWRNAP